MSYGRIQAYELAKRYLERSVRNNSNEQLVYYWLGFIYAEQGLYEKARKISELELEKFSDNPMVYLDRAVLQVKEGDFEQALSWCRQGFELDPNVFTDYGITGHVFLFMGDFPKAEEEYRKLLDSESEQKRSNGTKFLINVLRTQGRYDEMIRMAEQSLPVGLERRAVLAEAYTAKGDYAEASKQCEQIGDDSSRFRYLSDLYSKMGFWEKVEEIQNKLEKSTEEILKIHFSQDLPEQLKDFIPPHPAHRIRLSSRLRGLVELARGNYDQAIEHLQTAASLFRSLHNDYYAYVAESLARAYFEKGDLEQAKKEYESIGKMTYGRMNFGDIYAKSYYMLGRVYEKLGKKRDARKSYERFLEIWKNADPGLPEIEEARFRLNALRS
jgi:tetratricopeptide (TPR) repeat protein